ncbi:hypothetical protein QH494_22155 [Sphingomonas sp. AR_OL41]|uniref:hypothetical protein n=1 Tax=Sphingomonas sp. AR_OL41 TaxID=3042729 RepID=UPI002480D320|nr:hypothetical protein [Sphingomonas sp. AR_OL41]MDH7974902.1 hypothetical protein [Sphingomonas sp. AR_OL41]
MELKTIDVGIGMALMFLFVSVICSAVREIGELAIKTRASSLAAAIAQMLDTDQVPGRIDAFYNGPLISALFKGDYQDALVGFLRKWVPFVGRTALPSYIPADSFAKAVLQLVRDDNQQAGLMTPNATLAIGDLRNWAASAPPDGLKQAVQTALDSAGGELATAQAALEQWFNSAMERVSGAYKARTQLWLLLIGFVTAASMNIDAVTVMQRLSTDDTLCDAVVAQAGATLATCAQGQAHCIVKPVGAAPTAAAPPASAATPAAVPGTEPTPIAPPSAASTPPAVTASAEVDAQVSEIKAVTAQMMEVGWPIGWVGGKPGPQFSLLATSGQSSAKVYAGLGLWQKLQWWLAIVGGWLITAIGVTFGAPFWFDVLNRFMVVRSTVKPDEKSAKEKSKG